MPRTQTCFVFAICVFLLMECVTPQRRGEGSGGGRRGGRRQGGGRRGGRRQGGNQGNRFFGNLLTGGRPGQPFRPGGGGQGIGGNNIGGIVSTALLAGGQILNQLVNQGGLGGRPQGGFGGRPQGGFGGRPQGGFGGGGSGGRPQGGFGGRPQGGFGGGGFGGRPQGGFGGGGFGGRPQGGFGGGSFGGQPQGNLGSNNFGNSNFQNPIRPGTCPPVRPSCPPTRIVNRPEVCNSDIICGLGQKCCFDTCLQYSTCKGVV